MTYSDEKEIFADAIGARVVGHSISLDGDIGVNLYMELAGSIANSETAKMHFTIPTGSGTTAQDVFVKDARQVTYGDKTYYVFKCQVAAPFEIVKNIIHRRPLYSPLPLRRRYR